MSPYPTCGTCRKSFPAGYNARLNHLRMTGHQMPAFECDKCACFFNGETARISHMSRANHFKYQCHKCHETWPTEGQRTEHEHEYHYWCDECSRSFNNHNNLKMHLNSRIHRNYEIPCPFCKKHHNTATGLAYHVESGSCPNAKGLTRDVLYKAIHSKDPNGIMTNNLIGWHGSSHYEATNQAWNSQCRAWECYICHRLFQSISALNSHLNSPVHQEALYHCPKSTCKQQFKTLAAFCNHLESESCGFMRFDSVQRNFGNVVSGNRLIGF
ncbi:hypothetical protein F5Y18DRAFT_189590 [Xylariaceae sp. FL1019]|nr:hypothetical protein F5Y18DRAFT_189590 [Xylariaceae sp. FL1019]